MNPPIECECGNFCPCVENYSGWTEDGDDIFDNNLCAGCVEDLDVEAGGKPKLIPADKMCKCLIEARRQRLA